MKIRIFKRLVDGVFHVLVNTEDWSEHDRILMVKYGEPEINLGGVFEAWPNTLSSCEESSSGGVEPIKAVIDESYARVMTESPFTERFDSRDYGSIQNAKILATNWCSVIEDRILDRISELRGKDDLFNTEEITEY